MCWLWLYPVATVGCCVGFFVGFVFGNVYAKDED